MRRGFIFNHDLCTGCNACSAGCIIENRWSVKPRLIYQINPGALCSIPVVGLSMACNHCEKPACLYGCPAGAFYKKATTGAILLDESKCLGCNYCTWNCPYDSPKKETSRNIFLKCNLCFELLKDGGNPACASACPTAALQYGEIPEKPDNGRYSWMPDKNLDPSVALRGNPSPEPLRIIPNDIFSHDNPPLKESRKNIAGEWSLALFSFLSALSAGMIFSQAISDHVINNFLILSCTILAGIVSLLHLGKKLRAWRSLTNILKSPLSREIGAYIVYLLISASALYKENSGLIITAAVAGLVYLIIIDSVYTFADRRVRLLFHSGQTFLTGLLIGSFLSGMTASFYFIGSLKLVSGIWYMISDKDYPGTFGFRFLRLALLFVVMMIMIKGIPVSDPLMTFIFIMGEMIDRILFYYDFDPVNIKTTISGYTKSYLNEKKGY